MGLSTIKSGGKGVKPAAEQEPEAAPAVATAGSQPSPEADTVEQAKVQAMSEKARMKAILGSEEAKGREATANHLAFDTEMSAEDAVAILKTMPAAVVAAAAPVVVEAVATEAAPAAKGPNALDAAMAKLGNPAIEPRQGDAGAPEMTESAKLLAQFKAIGKEYGFVA